MSFQLPAPTLRKHRPNFAHYQNSIVSIFMGDFLPFYKGFPVETRADYKHFQALSNTVETMEKFLLITEILTHEY